MKTQPYCGFNNIDDLKADLSQAISECIVVPNHLLPAEFHDKKNGGRTLARLQELCAKRDHEWTEHQKAKKAKARNIERLAAQFEQNANSANTDMTREFDYSGCETNELQLHKNMIAMVKGMVNGGLLTAEDLLEE